MSRMNKDAVEALLDRDRPADVTLCVHSLDTHLWDSPEAGAMAVTRMIGHRVVPLGTDDGAEVPESEYLVVEIPLTGATLNGTAGHFRAAMRRLTDHTMESLMEDDDNDGG